MIHSILFIFYVSEHPDIDECASAPCQNGGTCVDQVNGYLCQCAPGYTDLQCQTGKEVAVFRNFLLNILYTLLG